MHKIAFLTTIFPMNDNFLISFFDSLKCQTFKFFDIVVVNDNYSNFCDIKKNYSILNIHEIKYSSTPAKNREFGINWCIKNSYDIIIFGDSDDYFAPNRIEKSLSFLNSYDIVVNDVSLFDEKGIIVENYFSHRLDNKHIINYEFIENKNLLGFTNTAVNTKILYEISFPEDITAVDWYFYKNLLKNNNAIFITETKTYYRQYNNNLVGLNNDGKFLFWWEK